MNIAFDAKRFFHNRTGLGNYSRTLVQGLAEGYPKHEYFLCNPKRSTAFIKPAAANVHELLPSAFTHKLLPAAWRSAWVSQDLQRLHINLYHGLSHEIPITLTTPGIPSVVTMHDLIFERYPAQYKKADIYIYRKKFNYACTNANRVIAISEATKSDLVECYGVDPLKIDVCYQSCDPAFNAAVPTHTKEALRQQLRLPANFFLYVGSVLERKNLLNICKALPQLSGLAAIPLVVVGAGRQYQQTVQAWLQASNLSNRVLFLTGSAPFTAALQTPQTMAAIYQMATALIYPSLAEGFGIPILEAMASRVPVITSNVSCMPETAGPAALYLSPGSPDEIAAAMTRIATEPELRIQLVQEGITQAAKFSLKSCTAAVMDVYKKIVT